MTSILVGPGSGDSGGPGRARGGTHTGSRGLGFRGIVEEHLEGALRARDHDPVRADGLDLSWAHSVPYGIAEHPLDQGVFEVGAGCEARGAGGAGSGRETRSSRASAMAKTSPRAATGTVSRTTRLDNATPSLERRACRQPWSAGLAGRTPTP